MNKITYDVFFTASGELNADENWQTVLKFYPNAKRIDDMPTIYDAYHTVGEQAEDDLVLIIDADNILLTNNLMLDANFNVDPLGRVYKGINTMVWRATNRVNTIRSGHGGLKLFNRKTLLNKHKGADVTMGLGASINPQSVRASIHAFDFSPYSTWKTAFRECAKMHFDTYRLSPIWQYAWCNEGFGEFGKYSILGARAGLKFAKENSKGALSMINNVDWLASEYNRIVRTSNINKV